MTTILLLLMMFGFPALHKKSVKVSDLRGFLKSDVFGLGRWSMAVFDENGRNLRLRCGNGAPGDQGVSRTGVSQP